MKYYKILPLSQCVSCQLKEVAEFTNLLKMLKASIVCYTDFQATLQVVSNSDTTGAHSNPPMEKKQIKYRHHNPASYFTKVISVDPNFQPVQEQQF